MSDLNNIDNAINENTALLSKENKENYNTIKNQKHVHAICSGYANNNASKNKLIKVVCVSTFFFLIELTGGLISGSLALLSDSFHLLSDVIGFLISLIAIIVSQRKATKKYSFGYHRAEVIGAILSLAFIWVLTVGLVIGAIDRLRHPVEINTKVMLITAIIGVIINLILAFTLHGEHGHEHGHEHDEHNHGQSHSYIHQQNHEHEYRHQYNDHEKHNHEHLPNNLNPHSNQTNVSDSNNLIENYKKENINVKAAIIHILGDLISSIGVVLAATIIYFDPSKVYIDPICTFIFSIIVIFTTINLLKQTLNVIMESTPEHIDSDEVIHDLKEIDGIMNIHDLHIWNITIGKPAIAAHISVKNEDLNVNKYQLILNNAQYILCTKYGIHHTTLQIEYIDSEDDNGKDDKIQILEDSGTSSSPSNNDILINIKPSDKNYSNYNAIHCKSNLCGIE